MSNLKSLNASDVICSCQLSGECMRECVCAGMWARVELRVDVNVERLFSFSSRFSAEASLLLKSFIFHLPSAFFLFFFYIRSLHFVHFILLIRFTIVKIDVISTIMSHKSAWFMTAELWVNANEPVEPANEWSEQRTSVFTKSELVR